MVREVNLNDVAAVLAELSYPASKDEVRKAFGDVLLRYADGEERLGVVLDRVEDDEFDSVDDLQTDLFNQFPTEAVGEPGQSEGEG
ncbi:DUF5789 family protein [Halobacteriaceae archaeon GCM10025711]